MIKKLVTHDGMFHADDVFAASILTRLFPEAEMVRTRDEVEITPAADRIIFDVGMNYEPKQMAFDHHQIGSPVRENESPYSSFGLIWKHFGMDWLEMERPGDPDNIRIHQKVDRSFVQDVDALDNGILVPGGKSKHNITTIIIGLNPDFDDNESNPNAAFLGAASFAGFVFKECVRDVAAKFRAERIMDKIMEERDPGPVLVLPYGIPFMPALRKFKADDVLFVITPRRDTWTIQSVEKKPGTFEHRAKLPEAWGGLRNTELARITGVDDAVFCHLKRFVAAAKSRDGIMKLAQLALDDLRIDVPDASLND